MTDLDQLPVRNRELRNGGAKCLDVDSETLRATALRIDTRSDQVRELVGRHDVERRSQRTGLHDLPITERSCQLFLPEADHARPERDVRGRRVLSLQSDEPPDSVRRRDPLALAEELAVEKRPVELPSRERPHGTTAAFSNSRGGLAKSPGSSSSPTRWDTSRPQ